MSRFATVNVLIESLYSFILRPSPGISWMFIYIIMLTIVSLWIMHVSAFVSSVYLYVAIPSGIPIINSGLENEK
mgnify:CR=1 FL=1